MSKNKKYISFLFIIFTFRHETIQHGSSQPLPYAAPLFLNGIHIFF